MFKVDSLVRIVCLQKEARISAIRVDDKGRPLIDFYFPNSEAWVARPEELELLEY